MKKSERTWAIRYGLVLAVFLTLPYLMGYFSESEDWRFTGFVFAVEDGNSYIAKMLTGSEGEWLFKTPYSTMDQLGVLAYLPYLVLGKLAAGPGLHVQLVVLYHLFRIFVTPFCVVATYRFIALFVKDLQWRRWGTILSTVGGGLGWLMVMLGKGLWFDSLPMDWISPEWFGFLAYFGTPHLILARGLLLTGLTFYLSSPGSTRRPWYSGLTITFAGLVHPLSLVTTFAILAVHQLAVWIASWRRAAWIVAKKWMFTGIKVVLLPLPLTIYYAVRFTTDPFLKVWTAQNKIFSPHFLHVLVAYGLMFIPAVLGMLAVIRSRRWTGLILVAWILAFPIFAYAPHNLQRRLPEGIWIAWITIAALGLWNVRAFSPKQQILSRVILFGFSIPTAMMLFISGIQVSTQTRMPLFRPADEVAVFEWLANEEDENVVVLCSFETGNALPAWAPVRVVMGHGPETVNFSSIQSQVKSFYSGEMTQVEQTQFLQSYQVDYVFMGPDERAFGDLELLKSPFFELRVRVGEYKLFEVKE
jgi:hypothetical protein